MATTDWEFVYDGVVGFLTSPMWQIPVISFIEKNCIVFDPSEENCLPWADIHKEYKKLVEVLLSSYLKDVGISEEQFVESCSAPSIQNRHQMQVVFEQIWAAEDYEIFKRMMVQRNIELELQALHLIQHQQQSADKPSQQQKVTPAPAKPRKPVLDDDAILTEVLKRSKAEYELINAAKVPEGGEKTIEKHWAESHEDNVKVLTEKAEEKREEMKRVVADRINVEKVERDVPRKEITSEAVKTEEKQTAKEEVKPIKNENPNIIQDKKQATTTTTTMLSPIKSKPSFDIAKPKSAAEAASSWLHSAKAEAMKGSNGSQSVLDSSGKEDLKRREEYLKQQRDKLLQLKDKEREKQLDTYAKTQPKRPVSARVARQAVIGTSEIKEKDESDSTADPKKLAMRKALADRLKKEVIYK